MLIVMIAIKMWSESLNANILLLESPCPGFTPSNAHAYNVLMCSSLDAWVTRPERP